MLWTKENSGTMREKALGVFKQALVGLETSNAKAEEEKQAAHDKSIALSLELAIARHDVTDADELIEENNKTIRAIQKLGV